MKKRFALSLLISSTSVFAVSPTFTPQNLEGFKGVQKDSMSRLRVNTNTANQIAKSLNFSEIDSTETRLIEGSDTPVVPRNKSLWLRLLQLLHLQ